MSPRHLACALAALVLATVPAAAQQSVEEIVRALTPHGQAAPSTRDIRGIQVTESAEPPSVDIRVEFAYNSADLDGDAIMTLNRLGQALRDAALEQYRFKIAGHTDARGSDEFNMDLSRRRAQTVVTYLEATFGIAPFRLVSEGHGESQLLDPTHPEDGVNRRVQIVNLGVATE